MTLNGTLARRGLVALSQDNNVALTQAFANPVWPAYADYVASARGLGGDALRARPETAALRHAVLTLMRGTKVLKVKAYNLDGLTVFSTEAAQIGDDKSTNAGFVTARGGKIASELRTPLHATLSFAALGMMKTTGADHEKLRMYFTQIHDSGEVLRRLVDTLLDRVRLESGRLDLRVEPSDLAALTADTVADFAAPAAEANIELVLDQDPAGVPAEIDPDRYQQVVGNLLGNAVKFPPPGTAVRITLRRDPASPGTARHPRHHAFRAGRPGRSRPRAHGRRGPVHHETLRPESPQGLRPGRSRGLSRRRCDPCPFSRAGAAPAARASSAAPRPGSSPAR